LFQQFADPRQRAGCMGIPVSIQGEAIRALAKIGPAAASALPRISELLKEDDLGNRYYEMLLPLVETVGEFGPAAHGTYQAFSALADSDDPVVRSAALCALAVLKPDDPRVLAALQQDLSALVTGDVIWSPGDTIFEECRKLGSAARPVVPALE